MFSLNKFDCTDIYDDINIFYSECKNQIFNEFIKYKDILSDYENMRLYADNIDNSYKMLELLPLFSKSKEIPSFDVMRKRKLLYIAKCNEFSTRRYIIIVNKFINCKLFISVNVNGFEEKYLNIFLENKDIYVNSITIDVNSFHNSFMNINSFIKGFENGKVVLITDKLFQQNKITFEKLDSPAGLSSWVNDKYTVKCDKRDNYKDTILKNNIKFFVDFKFNFKFWNIRQQSFCDKSYQLIAIPNNINDILEYKYKIKSIIFDHIKNKFLLMKSFKTLFGNINPVFDKILQSDIQDRITSDNPIYKINILF